jgi:RNA polymerase sigma-70 factor (ECF subfamily)
MNTTADVARRANTSAVGVAVAIAPEVFARALGREPDAVRSLIAAVAPVVQARVARAVLRQRSTRAQGRDVREEVRDLSQEVFAALFDDDARALRAWRPSGGLSLANYVGLIAEHQVANVFRSGKRRPWTDSPMVDEDVDAFALESGSVSADRRVASRELYERLLDRLRAELSPRGLELFHALIVQEQPVDDVCAQTGLTTDAVYAWRSRLAKLVRKLAVELDSERRLAAARAGVDFGAEMAGAAAQEEAS